VSPAPRPAEDAVCSICDGGPGNECACSCGQRMWDRVECCHQTVLSRCPGCPHAESAARPKTIMFEQGASARIAGKQKSENPYTTYYNRRDWDDGWDSVTPSNGSGDFAFGSAVWPGISKVVEECAEVIQVAGKLMQRGGRTDHWSGDLLKMMIEELGDCQAAIDMLIELNDRVDAAAVEERRRDKRRTFRRWHQENMGNPAS